MLEKVIVFIVFESQLYLVFKDMVSEDFIILNCIS